MNRVEPGCGSRRRRIGVGGCWLQPLALLLPHIGIVFRRALSGWRVLWQAAGPGRYRIGDHGSHSLIDRRAAAKHRAGKREGGDRNDMAGTKCHERDAKAIAFKKDGFRASLPAWTF